MSRLLPLPLLAVSLALALALALGALPACAQTKKPVKAVPAPSLLPLLLGVGAGLVAGGALGFALKKPSAPVKTDSEGHWFDEAPFPLAVIDETEKISRANRPFSLFLGLPDATGSAFPQWVHPDDLTRLRAQLHDLAERPRASAALAVRLFDAEGRLLHAQLKGQKAAHLGAANATLLALQDVTAQIEAQDELVGARDAIAALYEVISGDKTRDLDGKMKALLAMGCGRFELPIGALGRFCGDGLETLFVQSPDRRVRPALQLRRDDSSPEAQLLGLRLLPTRVNWREHPFICGCDSVSYLGAPVLVNGEPFGMLSFSGPGAREKPLAGGDTQLLQLMAEWIGGEIERDRARQALEKQQRELLEANVKLEMLATHDPLTGAKNRRAFNEKLEEEWSRAKRYNTPLSLVLMDVDKFKSYNDTFGHPAGDEVLKRVARTLMAAIRTTDFFARYGGEEFVLILPNTDAEGALILANRLREKIELAPWKERAVTASMGVATLTGDLKAGAELTQLADNALYASKENGRNRVTHVRDVAVSEG